MASLLIAPATEWRGDQPPLTPVRVAPTRQATLQFMAGALLAATVLFNPALAWVNAHVRSMSGGMVALLQAMIVIGAFVVGTVGVRTPRYQWLFVTWLLVMALAAISAVKGSFDMKTLGDMLIIPAFILLGARLRSPVFITTMLCLQGLLLLVGIWELASPGGYGDMFSVSNYYVNTRGYKAEAFWAGGNLFLSSERPQGRFLLESFGWHRGSSLFLEPVSLGNWAIVAVIFTAMMWRRLNWAQRLFMAGSTAALLVVCDGRLALFVSLLLCLYLPIARFIPGWISSLYLPVVLLVLAVGQATGLLVGEGDNFVGRLNIGFNALTSMPLERLMGVSDNILLLDDAGWADLVQSQSVFVGIGLWLVLTLTSLGNSPGGRMAKHGIALFIVLCLPISNSMLSIKTAAMMWACYGFRYAIAQDEPEEEAA